MKVSSASQTKRIKYKPMKVSSVPQTKLNIKYKPMKVSSAPQTKLKQYKPMKVSSAPQTKHKIQTNEG